MSRKNGKYFFSFTCQAFIQASLLLAFFSLQTVFAGVLDPDFGVGGRFTVNLADASSGSAASDVFIQPGGRILASAGVTCPGSMFFSAGYAYAGLNQNGSLDTTFGTGGKVVVCTGGFFRTLRDTKILPGGGYLSLGYSSLFKSPDRTPFIYRSLPDGSLDNTFSANISLSPDVLPIEASLLPEGKVLVLVISNQSYHLIRLNSNGSRDDGFGINGVRELPAQRVPFGLAVNMQVDRNGKILLAFDNGTVARYDGQGFLDRSFGLQGIYTPFSNLGLTPYILKMLLQPDGRIILFGGVEDNDQDVVLARITSRGKLDGDFGNGGIVVSDFDAGGVDYANDAELLGDGSIVIAGVSRALPTSPNNFLLAKYSAGGTLLSHTRTSFPGFSGCVASGITVEPDGKILAVGNATVPNVFPGSSGRFAVARYNKISTGEPAIRRLFDFDGDGITDYSVYRQDPGSAEQSFWDIFTSRNNSVSTFFGINGDIPLPADINADEKTDIVVFRPSTGTWFFTTNIAVPDYELLSFGQSGDIPLTNDYDGDFKADFVLFRPKTATWFIRRTSDESIREVQFGRSTDKPLTGDFDGDGKADLAVWSSSDGMWSVLKSSDGMIITKQLGSPADTPVPADYDGDEKTDFAIFNAAFGFWTYYKSLNGQQVDVDWGAPGDLPVAGDYDGDGKADTAVFRPSTGTWWIIRSANNTTSNKVFGASSDLPLPGR